MEHKLQIPVYEKIAIDIAHRIYNGSIKVGDRIHGRSTMASEYNVSPETIRRAIRILEDVGIVHSTKGSGTLILSKEKAYFYINRFSNLQSIRDLERQVDSLVLERKKIDDEINDSIHKILDYSHRLKSTNPLSPIEIEISSDNTYIGKSISEMKFWQNTGGTIIGIRRENKLIISPGPYIIMQAQDVLLIIGDEKIYERVLHFFNIQHENDSFEIH
jgi:K+/H+ antiporter YhaU regulatory subunit KhtT